MNGETKERKAIPIPKEAVEQLQTASARIQRLQFGFNQMLVGVARALQVPTNWKFDPVQLAFVPPKPPAVEPKEEADGSTPEGDSSAGGPSDPAEPEAETG